MSGLLVNILRRNKFYNVNNKSFDIPLQALVFHKDFYLTGCLVQKDDNESTKSSAAAKKKTKESIKISLIIGKNNLMSVTTLEEAQKLSRRRDLKLIKVNDFDTKSQRPVYKMMSSAEILAEEVTSDEITDDRKSTSSKKKHEKYLNIGSRIAQHDLESRLKNISKWVSKGVEVRVLIQGTGTDDSGSEKIFSAVQATVKEIDGRIVQKIIKDFNIKFTILPKASEGKDS